MHNLPPVTLAFSVHEDDESGNGGAIKCRIGEMLTL